MGLFKSSSASFLGIDLGAGNLKVIELQNDKGRPKLLTYGSVEIPFPDQEQNIFTQPNKVAAILKKICLESRCKSRRAVAALPVSSVFSSIINLPKVSKKELASPKNLAPLIHWEAKKLIPLPLEEMILDWQVLEKEKEPVANTLSVQDVKDTTAKMEKKNDSELVKSTRVLLTAASKEVVKNYVDIFKGAGIELLNLETDIFALIRSLIGNDRSTIMIVDIGARTTNVSIVDNGVPYLNKTINLGGWHLTKTIAESLSLPVEQAEQFKLDLSLGSEEEFPLVLKKNVIDLVNEIRYSMNLFMSSQSNKNIEKVILTGGSSLLPSLTKYLSGELKIRVYVGDPWARVMYPVDLRPILDEIGPRFSVTIGLAMRNILSS